MGVRGKFGMGVRGKFRRCGKIAKPRGRVAHARHVLGL